jgi:hypothetical protein
MKLEKGSSLPKLGKKIIVHLNIYFHASDARVSVWLEIRTGNSHISPLASTEVAKPQQFCHSAENDF